MWEKTQALIVVLKYSRGMSSRCTYFSNEREEKVAGQSKTFVIRLLSDWEITNLQVGKGPWPVDAVPVFPSANARGR